MSEADGGHSWRAERSGMAEGSSSFVSAVTARCGPPQMTVYSAWPHPDSETAFYWRLVSEQCPRGTPTARWRRNKPLTDWPVRVMGCCRDDVGGAAGVPQKAADFAAALNGSALRCH
jgi:hypothetical protein